MPVYREITWTLAALVVVASLVGLLDGDIYVEENALWEAESLGHDIANLALGVPALVISALLAGRGSRPAWLVWLGSLAYFAYSYALYAFGLEFNGLFLVYVVIFGLSTWALIAALASSNVDAVRGAFSDAAPTRAVSGFLIFIGAAFYAFWLIEVVPAMLDGSVPENVEEADLRIYPIHVLDLSLALPALVVAGVLLRRGRALGYVLSGALLAWGALIFAAITARFLAYPINDEPVEAPPVIIVGVTALVFLGFLVRYLRELAPRRRT